MGETDINFRRAIRNVPRPILRLVFPGRDLEPLGPLDPSLDRSRERTGDNLFRVRNGGQETAIHLEIEHTWRPEMPARLFDYASSAAAATRLPLSSILLLLERGGTPPQGTGIFRVPDVEGDAFVFRYHVLPLWQLDARLMRQQLGIEAGPFCVAMQGADEPFVASLVREALVDDSRGTPAAYDTLQLLWYLSATILGADAARRIFNMESIIRHPNVQRLLHDLKVEGIVEGRAEGRVEGRAEGQLEGRVEEARGLLRKVLMTRRLEVPQDLQECIDRERDIEQIRAWHDAAVTARAIADVFQKR